MLTGCYPPRIGFGEFDDRRWVLWPGVAQGLSTAEETIASLLKWAGYATKLVGKWHCGDQPEFLPMHHGFDSYDGLPYSNDMGRQSGREPMPPLPLMRDEDVIRAQPDQAALTERYVEESLHFIREHRGGPFFLTSHACTSIVHSTSPVASPPHRRTGDTGQPWPASTGRWER
jgi:arylsulfatase A-like enzyme